MPTYSRLTREQRYTIESMLRKSHSQKSIAEAIGVHPSNVSRELRRGGMNRSSYGPCSTLRLDRFETVVNTTAPDAPATQEITNIDQSGFTVGWNASLLGNPAEGCIVEVVAAGSPFRSGCFISEDGAAGHASGQPACPGQVAVTLPKQLHIF